MLTCQGEDWDSMASISTSAETGSVQLQSHGTPEAAATVHLSATVTQLSSSLIKVICF
jgi:hypothetical protein